MLVLHLMMNNKDLMMNNDLCAVILGTLTLLLYLFQLAKNLFFIQAMLLFYLIFFGNA